MAEDFSCTAPVIPFALTLDYVEEIHPVACAPQFRRELLQTRVLVGDGTRSQNQKIVARVFPYDLRHISTTPCFFQSLGFNKPLLPSGFLSALGQNGSLFPVERELMVVSADPQFRFEIFVDRLALARMVAANDDNGFPHSAPPLELYSE